MPISKRPLREYPRDTRALGRYTRSLEVDVSGAEISLADSDIPSSIARDAEVTAAIAAAVAAHLAAADPHPGYTTAAELAAAIAAIVVHGSWTPADASGAGLSLTTNDAFYTRIADLVTARAQFTYPATASGAGAVVSGLPFNLIGAGESYRQGNVSYATVGSLVYARPTLGTNTVIFRKADGSQYTNAELSGQTLSFEVRYRTA